MTTIVDLVDDSDDNLIELIPQKNEDLLPDDVTFIKVHKPKNLVSNSRKESVRRKRKRKKIRASTNCFSRALPYSSSSSSTDSGRKNENISLSSCSSSSDVREGNIGVVDTELDGINNAKRKRKESIPDHLCCPISFELMDDPVIDPNGDSYERANILAWIEKAGTSPITGKPLKKEDLRPNRALKQVIESL
eukprot:g2962.t1